MFADGEENGDVQEKVPRRSSAQVQGDWVSTRKNHEVRTVGSILFQQRGTNPKVLKCTSNSSARIRW